MTIHQRLSESTHVVAVAIGEARCTPSVAVIADRVQRASSSVRVVLGVAIGRAWNVQ